MFLLRNCNTLKSTTHQFWDEDFKNEHQNVQLRSRDQLRNIQKITVGRCGKANHTKSRLPNSNLDSKSFSGSTMT